MKHTTIHAVLLVAVVVSSVVPTIAQGPTGTPPFASFGGGPFDMVNLGDMNVYFTIPIRHKAGRIPFTVGDLSYDSLVWTTGAVNGHTAWVPRANSAGSPGVYWGWEGLSNSGVSYIQYSITALAGQCGQFSNQNYSGSQYGNFVYYDEHGTAHPFSGGGVYFTTANCPSGGPQPGPSPAGTIATGAQDGSGLTMYYSLQAAGITAYLTTKSGATLNPPIATNPSAQQGSFSETDANGNKITAVNGTYTDTLGQTVLSVVGSAPSNTLLSYSAPTGTATYTVSYVSYTVKTAFACGTIAEYNTAGIYLVDKITLPDNTFYQFKYEQTPGDSNQNHVTARLAQVTLPTGGVIGYQYGGANDGMLCNQYGQGSTSNLTRTVTPGGTWTYTWTDATSVAVGNGYGSTTVQDPNGNQTVMSFVGYLESQRQVYQGAVLPANLMLTTTTCYVFYSVPNNLNSCTVGYVGQPIYGKDVTLQYPNNGLQSETDTAYNNQGLVAETDQYGYGSGGRGSLLRKTVINYATNLGNILDHPSSVTVTDGNAKVLSNTTYAYDEYSSYPLQSTNGTTPQHVSVSGARGNATTITSTVIGTTTLTRHFAYYDTGNVYKAYDVNGAVTTYNYDTTAQGNSTKSCGNSFATSLTSPIAALSNGSTAWNCGGGVATAVTDVNGNATTTLYNDSAFWRPASVTDPTTASTTFTYTAFNPSTQALANVESKLLFNSTNSVVDQLTTVGGFGNSLYTQQREGPNSTNYDSTQVLYDSFLRANVSSMPCMTTTKTFTTQNQACPSAATTTSVFDALGRISQTTDSASPTPGYVTYTYNQNDVLQDIGPHPTNEHDKIKQLEYDALGRLTSVCELTSTLAGNGNCAQKNPQTGYWTTYAYSVNGSGYPTTTVTQNAQSSSTQTRTYTYDLLGRLISEQNPETGTTTYTYDSDAAGTCSGTYSGDLVKLTDARGNKICYQYDAIHRVTQITYPTGLDSANTPMKTYVYDAATYNTTAMSNAKGQLAEAYTGSSSSRKTDEFFSYSVRGELTDTWECTPHSGGTQCNGGTGGYYYHVTAGFWANGALNTLSSSNISVPTQTYGADGMGRTSTVFASSGQNPVTATSYNLSTFTYGVTFGSQDSDSFTLDSHTGRMTNYTFTMGTKTDSGTTTWNANGSLATLAISDQITGTSDTQTCNYAHDDLARIASVNCGSAWAQTLALDPFGNLSKSGSVSFQPIYTGTILAPGTTPTNQYYQIPGGATGASNYYDANGRVINDLSHAYTWDAEDKMVTLDTTTLTHDALGRMVEKGVGSAYTQFVYAPMGNVFATMNGQNLQNAYVPLPAGTAVYNSTGLAYYRHRDHLGSSRLSTTPSRTMYSSTAYAPYGEAYAQTGATDVSFTGQDQYTTAGTYDFLARKFNPAQGRWLSPDPSGLATASPENPQSWNRYAYVLNNPMALVDPLGLDCVYVYDDGSTYVKTGDCNSSTDNGYYVDGTVTGGTYDPNTGDLNFTFDYSCGGFCIGVGDVHDPNAATSLGFGTLGDTFSMPTNDGTGPQGVAIGFGGFGNSSPLEIVKARQKECVNNFHDTKVGKAVQLGSLVAMTPFDSRWGQNWAKFGRNFTLKTLIVIGENPVSVTVQVFARYSGVPLVALATYADTDMQISCAANAVKSLGAGW